MNWTDWNSKNWNLISLNKSLTLSFPFHNKQTKKHISISLYKQCQLGQECCSGSCLSFSYRCVGSPKSPSSSATITLSQLTGNRNRYQSDQPQIIDAHIPPRGASCQAINEQVSLVFLISYFFSSSFLLLMVRKTTNHNITKKKPNE